MVSAARWGNSVTKPLAAKGSAKLAKELVVLTIRALSQRISATSLMC
jgi:hypothetical protein